MAFSVLMSVYINESPAFFRRALQSIWDDQLLKPDQIVLMVDGKITSELEKVISDFILHCDRMDVFRIEENVQLGRALAIGVKKCKYDLIARMDTDDISLPERFLVQCEYMEKHPEIDVLGSWIEEFDGSGWTKEKRMPLTNREIAEYAKYRNPINHMSAMYRKNRVLDAGNYIHFPFLEDYHLWSRMLAANMHFANVDKVLVNMRFSSSTYNRRMGLDYLNTFLKLRKFQQKMGLFSNMEYLKSIAYTVMFAVKKPKWLQSLMYRKVLRHEQ